VKILLLPHPSLSVSRKLPRLKVHKLQRPLLHQKLQG
jgi:hypothetical protein